MVSKVKTNIHVNGLVFAHVFVIAIVMIILPICLFKATSQVCFLIFVVCVSKLLRCFVGIGQVYGGGSLGEPKGLLRV